MKIEEKAAELLIKLKKTLAVAESCSGGLLTHRLTNIPGSSQFLKVGIMAYSNEAKIKLLKVSPSLIKKYGAVSPETACAMAQGVRLSFKTDFGVSITGIAGPTGGTKTKPIGLTYISMSSKEKLECLECHFKGSRLQVKESAATKALSLLLKFITSLQH